MKTFCDLKLIGSIEEQEKLIDRIEQLLKNGWERARGKEAEAESKYKMSYVIFSCTQLGSRPAAALFFTTDKNGYLYICNIVPTDGRLGVDGYNALLNKFHNQFIEPAVQGLNIQIIITPGERNIDNSMSSEMARLLKSFSAAANKSSGGTHPCDEERFFDFIIQAHEEGSLLDESQLKGLLIDDSWVKEDAFELSCKYRFGRDLLKRLSPHN